MKQNSFFLSPNLFSSRLNISVKGFLQFQSLSIRLLLKLIDTTEKRSHLILLFHKFRSCLTEQKIFISFKKRSSNI